MDRYPLLIVIIFLGLSLGVNRIYPLNPGIGLLGQIAGGTALICGIVLLAVSLGHFLMRGTTVMPTREPDKLVTEGIYRISRNPMYLGMLLILVGVPFVMASVTGLIFALLFFLIMDQSVIPREEKMVQGIFGEDYLEYKSHTRRWI